MKSKEEDKHPTIPMFPETTNSKISITRLPDFNFDETYNIDSLFFKISNRYEYLYFLDANCIHKKDSIKISEDNFITQSGSIYYKSHRDESNVFKLNIKTGKKEKIAYTKFNPLKEYLTLIDDFKKKEAINEETLSDSLKYINAYKRYKKASKIVTEKIEKIISPGLLEATSLKKWKNSSNHVLLKYKDKEVVLRDNLSRYLDFYDNYVEAGLDLKKYKEHKKMKVYSFEETDLISFSVFDTAIRGNSLETEGKKTFFSQYGYEYTTLTLNKIKTNFKITNTLNEDSPLKSYILPDKKTIILLNTKSRYSYKVNW